MWCYAVLPLLGALLVLQYGLWVGLDSLLTPFWRAPPLWPPAGAAAAGGPLQALFPGASIQHAAHPWQEQQEHRRQLSLGQQQWPSGASAAWAVVDADAVWEAVLRWLGVHGVHVQELWALFAAFLICALQVQGRGARMGGSF